jgi:parvulin-like peptidyl-prolyl isomerase
VPHRLITLATLCFFALLLRAAIGQQAAPQTEPPPSPFSGGREDPYFPKAAPVQRFPIVNQPTPLPKLGTLTGEPVDSPPPGFREPLLRQPAAPDGQPLAGGDEGLSELGDRFEPGKIVARVGDQVILYGDVAWLVDQDFVANRAKITNKFQLEELNKFREMRIRNITKQLAEKKLQYLEFRRAMAAKTKDKLKEAEKDLNKNVTNAFEKGLDEMRQKMDKATTRQEITDLMGSDIVLPRLAVLMKENNLVTMAQLDETLRSFGSSMDKQVTMFREHHLGQKAVVDKLGKPAEVSARELLDYYHEHADKFAVPAKVRFELLSVYLSKVEGRNEAEKKAAALKKIADMGNAVFLGRQFPEVAKEFSHEANALTGGQYDWISKGSLASEVIDTAVFSLPLNRLSAILADERGYHIVRVQERSEARQTPFEEAQKEIKEKILKERREAKIKVILAELKKGTPIWTIYDEEEEAEAARRAAAKAAELESR